MNRRKTVIFFNSLLLLFLILFVNFKKEKVVPNNDISIKQQEEATSQVLSENSEKISYAVVSRVIDGDTIELNNGEKVRYIGIDTPELDKGKECYAQKSAQKNTDLVLGKTVRLEKDVSERDKYQRLLRYVYITKSEDEKETFVNEILVKNGYAVVSTYPPDVKYKDLFLKAERDAREGGRGLWGECTSK